MYIHIYIYIAFYDKLTKDISKTKVNVDYTYDDLQKRTMNTLKTEFTGVKVMNGLNTKLHAISLPFN